MKLTLIVIIIITFMVIVNNIIMANINMIKLKSDVDNREYFVRELKDSRRAANIIGKLRQDLLKLIKYMETNIEKYKDYEEYINELHHKFDKVVLMENNGYGNNTSYSINKGEKIVFCLRSKITNELHDYNVIMYVALHEISHIACPEYGHTELFKKIFAFIAKIATEINIYEKQNFNMSPVEYCGITISESII